MSEKRKIPIRYTDRDFNSIKSSLVEHAKRYYPDSYKDFNEASFGSLLLDSAAYIGDVLSFYLDYQANESFLETAIEKENIISLSKNLGYKYSESISSFGEIDLYITVPVNSSNNGPDLRYAPILLTGTTFSSENGGRFSLIDKVDFRNSNNLVVVASVDATTGAPTEYAIKAMGQVRSGFVEEKFVEVEEYKRYTKIKVEADNISEVISVEDSEGHRYYEVEHLSQDVIYKDVSNRNTDRDRVTNIIKPFSVPRRFTTDFFPGFVEIQFGQGSEQEIMSGSFLDPSRVVLNQFGKEYVSDTYLDPTSFTSTEKMGISPSNTTLLVRLRTDDVEVANAPAGSINSVLDAQIQFEDESGLNFNKLREVRRSLEVYNEKPVVGDLTVPTEEDIKIRARNSFASQNRAVTRQDYTSMVYSMPTKFGAVKRCRIDPDMDSFKRNINIYTVSEDFDGRLVESSITLKNNLKKWIEVYKMMGDTFDILDGRIVNIAIDYEVMIAPTANKAEAIIECNREIQEIFRIHPEFGEALYLNDIYNVLGNLESVIDVIDVQVTNKHGGVYTDNIFSIKDHLSIDGRTLKIPFDHVYELKFPITDIKGTAI